MPTRSWTRRSRWQKCSQANRKTWSYILSLRAGHAERGDYPAASSLLEQAIKLKPDDFNAYIASLPEIKRLSNNKSLDDSISVLRRT